VFYGAAEFSRDTDLAILANSENLAKLKKAIEDLQAVVIAVPPFDAKYLRKGASSRAAVCRKSQMIQHLSYVDLPQKSDVGLGHSQYRER
jgi:hypothetical protein